MSALARLTGGAVRRADHRARLPTATRRSRSRRSRPARRTSSSATRSTPASLERSIRYAIDRKRTEVQLAHLALHDHLTGLPNRSVFDDRLEHALQRRRNGHGGVAVLFIDIDGFKRLNDSFGHGAGDDVLREAAARIRSAVRPHDTVARLGGDEFTVLCEGIDGDRGALAVGRRVADELATAARDRRPRDRPPGEHRGRARRRRKRHRGGAPPAQRRRDVPGQGPRRWPRRSSTRPAASASARATRSRSSPRCGARSRASWWRTTSRWSSSTGGGRSPRRRWCAGSTRSRGLLPPGEFIPVAEESRARRGARGLDARRGVPGGGRLAGRPARVRQRLRSPDRGRVARRLGRARPRGVGAGAPPPPARADRDGPHGRHRGPRRPHVRAEGARACRWRSTTSARATRRSATSTASRSTGSRSTARSSAGCPTAAPDLAIVSAVVSFAGALDMEVVAEGVETQEHVDALLEPGL